MLLDNLKQFDIKFSAKVNQGQSKVMNEELKCKAKCQNNNCHSGDLSLVGILGIQPACSKGYYSNHHQV